MSQSRNVSSIDIRNRFLEYFTIEKSHTFIRSSPVVPLHDKSLAFVNAGMNQVSFSFYIQLSTVGLYSLSSTVRPKVPFDSYHTVLPRPKYCKI